MILWFGIALMIVALLAGLSCIVAAVVARGPNDITLGATVLVGILLLVQIPISIAQPMLGNPSQGDPLEFWLYLIVAVCLPFGAGFWALIDRTKWSNLVLGIVHVAVAVMTYRMLVIWG